MRWSIIRTIVAREVRDQVRDRRTLFMVFVLPILLYPMLGFGVLQLTAMIQSEPSQICIIVDELPEDPKLVDPATDWPGWYFVPKVLPKGVDPARIRVLLLRRGECPFDESDSESLQAAIRNGFADVIAIFPTGSAETLDDRKAVEVTVAHSTAYEKSQLASSSLLSILSRWNRAIVARRLAVDGVAPETLRAVELSPVDVAQADGTAGISLWARILPFLLVLMALTGTFYPAVDLCAGEKERGTMETLLIAPVGRNEVVLAKFLTVALAGAVTALLNLVSMGLTCWKLAGPLSDPTGTAALGGDLMAMTAPNPEMILWMVLLLIPLAAFFAAVCLALAVVARSMKEAQYYLTPVYLVTLPLVLLSLTPGVKLDLFYSLIPVSGVSLLLRSLMLGEYEVARPFVPIVMGATITYAVLALQFAVEQFKGESILARESEKFDLIRWLTHLVRDRDPIPNGLQALACFATIVLLAWFLGLSSRPDAPWTIVMGQIGFILVPPIAMAWLFTSNPRRTLRLRWPKPQDVVLAPLAALALHPLVVEVGYLVQQAFPIPEPTRQLLERMMNAMPGLGTSLIVLALVPAICEEFAFRGAILSGLKRDRRESFAVGISALMFGMLHVFLSLPQQLIPSTLLGVILGYLALRTGSLVPGILFHATNNALALTIGRLRADSNASPALELLFRDDDAGLYQESLLFGATALAIVILWVMIRRAR